MNRSWLKIIYWLMLIFLSPCFLYASQSVPKELNTWQFRWGDSPVDSNGIPEWITDKAGDSWWTDIDVPVFYGMDQSHYVWLRTRINPSQWNDPTIFVNAILYSFAVYLDSSQVYTYGKMSGKVNKFESVRWHMIHLDNQSRQGDQWLYFRIYSDNDTHVGLPLQADNRALIGSQWDIIVYIIQNSIDRFVLGVLFILIGFMSVDFFFHRWKQKPYIYLPFALFTLCIGMAYTFSSEISQIVFNHSKLRFACGFGGMLLFPVGLFMFYEFLVLPAHKRIFRVFWQSLLVIGISIIVLEFTNLIHFDSILYPVWMVLILMTYFFALVLGIMGAIQGTEESKIFNGGFIVMILFTMHDIFFMFGIIPYWRWMSQWGVLLFILTLLHLIERRNLHDHKKLIEYSHELQDYRDELENRVIERTRDLHERNETLRKTMDELQQTQQQLVLKEKMASLGHLVAGVAHELNNPIGAVSSAANVFKRGLAKIKAQLNLTENKDLAGEIGPTWEILEQNTRIISEGGERVARIVKSLKNFARLDEAEFQKADIHEGLDSTLDLLHHEFKNRITIYKEYGNIPRIPCYPNQLNQVFLNLLSNASQAITGQGDITITTECLDGQVIVRITDTGKGIPADDLPHLFDPGFTTKGVGVGTGLGLSISYNIIKKHNGDIHAKSRPGHGATFTIQLPMTQA